MTNRETTEQARSENYRGDTESVRDGRNVAWYARADGGVYYTYEADTPVYVGEVYEIVSAMLKHAPLDFSATTTECATEVVNQRAWAGFVELVHRIFVHSLLYDLPDDVRLTGKAMTRHGGDRRLDLELYVYPFDDDWYPMPSNVLLVADPVLIPDEMLKVLLTWNGDGESMAMVTDRPVEWCPTETGTV